MQRPSRASAVARGLAALLTTLAVGASALPAQEALEPQSIAPKDSLQQAPPTSSLTIAERLRFSMRIGVARSVVGFDRQLPAGGTERTSHYRLRSGAVWGAALTYAHREQFGLRADLDAVGPVRISEVSRNADVVGQSVAWLGALSLTYSPRVLCQSSCLSFSAGPGVGFYELGEHTEVAFTSGSFPVSKTQLAYATRASVELRAPGRFRSVVLGVSDYIVKFSPAAGAPDMSTMHHVVLSLGWTPP